LPRVKEYLFNDENFAPLRSLESLLSLTICGWDPSMQSHTTMPTLTLNPFILLRTLPLSAVVYATSGTYGHWLTGRALGREVV